MATKFTDTQVVLLSTGKIPVETQAGVKGYTTTDAIYGALSSLISGDTVPAFATQQEAYTGTSSTTLMSPLRVAQVVALSAPTIPTVPSFATQQEAYTGTSSTLIMSPLRVAQVVSLSAPVVPSFATQQQAYDGTSSTLLMSPLRVAQVIALSAPTANTFATQQQAYDGTSNTLLMSPLRVSQVIALSAPVVPSFASQQEAYDGTSNTLIMSPLRVAQVLTLSAPTANTFATQQQAYDGTSSTTMMSPLRVAQVIALSSYTFATQQQAYDGISSTLMMSPLRVAQVITLSANQVTASNSLTFTNKTLTSPIINVTSDATGDIYYRSAGGAFTRLPIGATSTVLTVAAGLPSWAAPAGGGGTGLTNWYEALSSAAPNATITVSNFTASGSATNIDAVIRPKGTGSLIAAVPDNGTTGGNKRGTNSVDWQMTRTANSKVASGANSVIGGGQSNTASNTTSTVGGGDNNTASGISSTVGGGASNSASNTYSTVGGGASNNVSQTYGTIGGGNSNTVSQSYGTVGGGESNNNNSTYGTIIGGRTNSASGAYGVVLGGNSNASSASYGMVRGTYASDRGIHGTFAQAPGNFDGAGFPGQAQTARYPMQYQTADATQKQLTSNWNGAAASNTMVIPNNSVYGYEGKLVARASGGNVKVWTFSGIVKKTTTAGSTALVGTPVNTSDGDSGASAWDLTIDADTTNGTLRFRITGAAATTIRWVGYCDTTEATF